MLQMLNMLISNEMQRCVKIILPNDKYQKKKNIDRTEMEDKLFN